MARLGRKSSEIENESPFTHYDDRPPHAPSCLAYKIGMLQRDLAEKRIAWPSEIPTKPLDAAQWWIERQEPCADDERPRLASCAQVDARQRWQMPYLNRLFVTLAWYCCLPDSHRETILAAQGDGVFWRGEEVITKDGGPGHFIRAYEEILQARKYPNARAYVEQTKLFDRMREAIVGKRMR